MAVQIVDSFSAPFLFPVRLVLTHGGHLPASAFLRWDEKSSNRNMTRKPDFSNSRNPKIAASLSPGRTNRLADQQRRVGAFPRDELLRTAAPHLCRVEIGVLVHAELMCSP